MSTMVVETMEMMNNLPIEDQEFMYNMAKKLIKAWDPDFTKLTPSEANEFNGIIAEVESGDYVSEDEIDWD